jgi:hypothetical protein
LAFQSLLSVERRVGALTEEAIEKKEVGFLVEEGVATGVRGGVDEGKDSLVLIDCVTHTPEIETKKGSVDGFVSGSDQATDPPKKPTAARSRVFPSPLPPSPPAVVSDEITPTPFDVVLVVLAVLADPPTSRE